MNVYMDNIDRMNEYTVGTLHRRVHDRQVDLKLDRKDELKLEMSQLGGGRAKH